MVLFLVRVIPLVPEAEAEADDAADPAEEDAMAAEGVLHPPRPVLIGERNQRPLTTAGVTTYSSFFRSSIIYRKKSKTDKNDFAKNSLLPASALKPAVPPVQSMDKPGETVQGRMNRRKYHLNATGHTNCVSGHQSRNKQPPPPPQSKESNKDKEGPNFGTSGKLLEDTNNVKVSKDIIFGSYVGEFNVSFTRLTQIQMKCLKS